MPTMYRIKDWDRLYETHETRKLKRLVWVPVPNKHDGLTFRRICAHPQSVEIFAAWILLLQLASKGENGQRGTLARGGYPLSPPDFALMTGFPERIFSIAFPVLVNMGWIESCGESPAMPGESPAMPGESPGRREGKGREGNGLEDRDKILSNTTLSPDFSSGETVPEIAPPPAPRKTARPIYSQEFLTVWAAYPLKVGKGKAMTAWSRVRERPPVDAILAAIAKQSASDDWQRDGGQFIPHLATWLNQRRWEDEGMDQTTLPKRSAFADGGFRDAE